jgi:anti-sigma regulatory factor (Ser/Thr protein kinase)
MNKIKLIILNRLENARLVGLCAKEISSEVFDDTALMEIELAAVEIVNNCIEHAYSEDTNQQISIEFWLKEDRLLIKVMDVGKSLDFDVLEEVTDVFNFDPQDFKNLPEGGMGLEIAKTCMDEVNYHNQNGTNCWLLTKYR